MNRRTVISLSLVPLACASSTAAAKRKKFIGSWRLISGMSTNEVTGAVGEAGLLSIRYDNLSLIAMSICDSLSP
jgi:hypothetical protein